MVLDELVLIKAANNFTSISSFQNVAMVDKQNE